MANNYTLEFNIDRNSLQIIKAAQLNITLAKSVGGASPSVAWLVFDPYQANTVEWTEEYGLYASTNKEINNGVVISSISELFPATGAAFYVFDSTATFKGPFTDSSALGTGQYKVKNQMPYDQYPLLTFGLEQKAIINGFSINPSPVNATLIPSQYDVAFTPHNALYVWLQADFCSGSAITSVRGRSVIVYFGEATHKVLTYDPQQGMFVSGDSSNGKMIDDPEVVPVKRAGIY